MKRFIEGTECQFDALRYQIQGALVTFPGTTLPATCTPNRCRLGFEFTPAKGYTLYIDKNIAYGGCCDAFRTLTNSGEVSFENYDDLVSMVRGFGSLYSEARSVSRGAVPDRFSNREEPLPCSEEAIEDALQVARRPIDIDSKRLYKGLSSKVIGQKTALTNLSNAIRIHLSKVKPERPASIFMAGPTGVGKTESAKALVKTLNEISETNFDLITIPCNQFAESHRISQLLGSPPGYVGYSDPSILAPLADNPRCVILWDEIDKAHPNILRALMRAMDEGSITLSSPVNGQLELDCRHSVFIFTSNQSLRNEERKIGFSTGIEEDSKTLLSDEDKCKEALVNNGLKPEIAGRIGWFLQYKRLTQKEIAKVIQQEIRKCGTSYGLSVKMIDKNTIKGIIRATDSKFGMRAYKQLIERKLGPTFAENKNGATCVSVVGSLKTIKVEPYSNEETNHG